MLQQYVTSGAHSKILRTICSWFSTGGRLLGCGQPHGSRSGDFPSVVKKNYGSRIAPDRVSSGPTRFTGSVAMDFMSGQAPIDPIEAKCGHFEVQSEIFLRLAKPLSAYPGKFSIENIFRKNEKFQNSIFVRFFL